MTAGRIFAQRTPGDRSQLHALLSGIWATEVLSPSSEVWLIAPAILNWAVLDNRVGEYTGVDQSWSWREIRLFDCLGSLLGRGTHVRLKATSASQNRTSLEELRLRARDLGAEDRLHVRLSGQLGSLGLLTGRCAVRGPLPPGPVGSDPGDRLISYTVDADEISATGTTFRAEW